MQYEFIPAGLYRNGKQKYAEKSATVVLPTGETRFVTWNPTRAVNPERRARKRVCRRHGITSGRQMIKLRKRIRREMRAAEVAG